jgi:hypothetical protein
MNSEHEVEHIGRPASGYLFTPAEGAGPMEQAAAGIVADIGAAEPIAAGYAHGLILAGRNLDRAELSRDPSKVDRGLSRWVELLGKLAAVSKREGGGDTDGNAVTEFDRYAEAVRVAGAGPAGLGNPPHP